MSGPFRSADQRATQGLWIAAASLPAVLPLSMPLLAVLLRRRFGLRLGRVWLGVVANIAVVPAVWGLSRYAELTGGSTLWWQLAAATLLPMGPLVLLRAGAEHAVDGLDELCESSLSVLARSYAATVSIGLVIAGMWARLAFPDSMLADAGLFVGCASVGVAVGMLYPEGLVQLQAAARRARGAIHALKRAGILSRDAERVALHLDDLRVEVDTDALPLVLELETSHALETGDLRISTEASDTTRQRTGDPVLDALLIVEGSDPEQARRLAGAPEAILRVLHAWPHSAYWRGRLIVHIPASELPEDPEHLQAFVEDRAQEMRDLQAHLRIQLAG